MAIRAGLLDTEAVVRRSLEGKEARWGGLFLELSMLTALLASLLILILLLVDVIIGAIPVFRERGLDFVTSGLSLNPATAGVWTAIVGSVLLSLIVAVIAFPLGIGAAVYLEEYAPENRFTRLINTNIRNLAGVPSIVYGLLGLAIFVPLVSAVGLGGPVNGKNVFAGALALAVLVLPIVIITSAEAIRAVPSLIREAGYGVGATQWEVIRHHVLPSAAPGILTGTILTLARAFGEAAPLLLVGVTTGFLQTAADASLFETLTGNYTALPITILEWSRQPGSEFQENLAPAAIAVLLVVLLTANSIAILLRNRYERRW